MIFQNFRETLKGTLYNKTFGELGEIKKIKIHMRTSLAHEKKDKLQVPQRNEMLSLYCTALGFVNKNEEYNSK